MTSYELQRMLDWRKAYIDEKRHPTYHLYPRNLVATYLDNYRIARRNWLAIRRHDRMVKRAIQTAAALVEAKAEIERLRESLAIIVKSAEFAIAQSTKSPQSQHLYSKACGWSAAAEIAARALETAPAQTP